MTDPKLQICHYAKQLYAQGYVCGTEGNLSRRFGEDKILITPASMLKAEIAPDNVSSVDLNGFQLSGNRKPTTEIATHLQVYRDRLDVEAIVHAHPEFTMLCDAIGLDFWDVPVFSESAMFLKKIAVFGFACPSTDESANLIAGNTGESNILILRRHGVFTLGKDLSEAFARMEILEKVARMSFRLKSSGLTPEPLTREQVERLKCIP